MNGPAFAFTAPLALHDVGRYTYRVLTLPDDLAARLPFDAHPRLRIEGEIAGVPFEGAFQPSSRGRYIMVSPELCRTARLEVGDTVTVRFTIADQDGVTVPDELTIALLDDGAAMEAWTRLTPGRQRGLCHHIASAKREETRARRVEAIVAALASGDPEALPGPPGRRR